MSTKTKLQTAAFIIILALAVLADGLMDMLGPLRFIFVAGRMLLVAGMLIAASNLQFDKRRPKRMYTAKRNICRPNMQALEPEDPIVVCECTHCRQDIYLDECTFEDGLGAKLCKECFEELISKQMRENIQVLAIELGYDVVRHERLPTDRSRISTRKEEIA